MSDPQITLEDDGRKRRYVIRHDDGQESELTLSVMSPGNVIADHTGVAEGHEGEGIGLLLVERLVADARKDSFRIVPLCPFVNAQRRKHPDWADVFNV